MHQHVQERARVSGSVGVGTGAGGSECRQARECA